MDNKIKVNIDSLEQKVLNYKVELFTSKKVLPFNEIDSVVSEKDVFLFERKNSDNYRINGDICINAINNNFNITGEQSLEEARDYVFINLLGEELDFELDNNNGVDDFANADSEDEPPRDASFFTIGEFCDQKGTGTTNNNDGDDTGNVNDPITVVSKEELFVLQQFFKEKSGWIGYENVEENKFFQFFPDQEEFKVIGEDGSPNYRLGIYYPSGIIRDFKINGLTLKHGLLIREYIVGRYFGRDRTRVSSTTKHGLVTGDIIRVHYDGVPLIETRVISLGEGLHRDYVFYINEDLNSYPEIPGSILSFKKMVNDTESLYMVKVLSPLELDDEIDISNIAISKNYYKDSNSSFATKEDINLEKYRDWFGRPLTEIYYAMIKLTGEDYGEITSGFDYEYSKYNFSGGANTIDYDVKYITDSSEGLEIVNEERNILLGEIFEFNLSNLRETTIETINHRYNTSNREENGQFEGYYYKPFIRKEIRKFSDELKVGNSNTVGLKDYAYELEPNFFIWREVLEIGDIENGINGVDYPFVNNAHYIYDKLNFNVIPQDFFDNRVRVRVQNNILRNGGDDVC